MRIAKLTLLSVFLISLLGAVLIRLFDPHFAGMLVVNRDIVDVRVGERLYLAHNCQSCHGPDGRQPLFETYPIIAGQPAQYNFNQTIDIRDGRRTNGASAHMRAVVQNVTDQEALEISEYLSRL